MHLRSDALSCLPSFWTLPLGSPPRGLTFVEWCLSRLVGDVRLSPSLEQGLEAVQVSPACRQVKGCFLLQGALVDGCRVCCGRQTRTFMKEKDTCLLPNTEVVLSSSQCRGQTCVVSAQFTTQTAFIISALNLVAFTGLFQLPDHTNPAQVPPPLGSLPWLTLLLL